jgi:hypothetical protein
VPRQYNPLKIKPFKFKRVSHGQIKPMPSFVSIQPDEPEALSGSVQGKTASAPEERLAKALDKHGIYYDFRFNFGAPKPLPGWKELDFLVQTGGLMYAIEVDTAFTHRMKAAQADHLHDALILADRNIRAMGELYPQVFHASGDHELATKSGSDAYVKEKFGR